MNKMKEWKKKKRKNGYQNKMKEWIKNFNISRIN